MQPSEDTPVYSPRRPITTPRYKGEFSPDGYRDIKITTVYNGPAGKARWRGRVSGVRGVKRRF
jgi:hypothetical protein